MKTPNLKSKLRNYKIQIINQDIDENFLFKSYLQKVNYNVEYAFNFKKGLLLVDTYRPDLIIVDKDILNMSVRDFVLRVKSVINDHDTPIILITNTSDKWDSERLYNEGIVDIITRPLDMKDFTARIDINLLFEA